MLYKIQSIISHMHGFIYYFFKDFLLMKWNKLKTNMAPEGSLPGKLEATVLLVAPTLKSLLWSRVFPLFLFVHRWDKPSLLLLPSEWFTNDHFTTCGFQDRLIAKPKNLLEAKESLVSAGSRGFTTDNSPSRLELQNLLLGFGRR